MSAPSFITTARTPAQVPGERATPIITLLTLPYLVVKFVTAFLLIRDAGCCAIAAQRSPHIYRGAVLVAWLCGEAIGLGWVGAQNGLGIILRYIGITTQAYSAGNSSNFFSVVVLFGAGLCSLLLGWLVVSLKLREPRRQIEAARAAAENSPDGLHKPDERHKKVEVA